MWAVLSTPVVDESVCYILTSPLGRIDELRLALLEF